MKIKLDDVLTSDIQQTWAKKFKAEFELLDTIVEKHGALTVESVSELINSMHDIGLNINVGSLMLLKDKNIVFENVFLNFNITEYQPEGIEIFVEPYCKEESKKDLAKITKFMDDNLDVIAKGIISAKELDIYEGQEEDYYWYFANR